MNGLGCASAGQPWAHESPLSEGGLSVSIDLKHMVDRETCLEGFQCRVNANVVKKVQECCVPSSISHLVLCVVVLSPPPHAGLGLDAAAPHATTMQLLPLPIKVCHINVKRWIPRSAFSYFYSTHANFFLSRNALTNFFLKPFQILPFTNSQLMI